LCIQLFTMIKSLLLRQIFLALLPLHVLGTYETVAPFSYQAEESGSKVGGSPLVELKGFSYEQTGFGSAESSIVVASDGSLIYSPAISKAGVGYAVSKDYGKTWNQVLPAGKKQARQQPMFREIDGRYFYWSTGIPGLHFSYSDDNGTTWKLVSKHLNSKIEDWAKLIGGKPVTSSLKNGARQILYLSAPSLISTQVAGGFGPIKQMVMKSVDRGETWTLTASAPTLKPLLDGGACAALPNEERKKELLIWGDGFVTSNGTIMFGLRRCRKLSVAISDDEGDSWRFSDVSGSNLNIYKSLLTYVLHTTRICVHVLANHRK
jgi:hypothetical protein